MPASQYLPVNDWHRNRRVQTARWCWGSQSGKRIEIFQTLRFRTRKTLTTTGNNLDVIDPMPRVGKALDTTQRGVLFNAVNRWGNQGNRDMAIPC